MLRTASILMLVVPACDQSGEVLHSLDSGGAGTDSGGTCAMEAWTFPNSGSEPAWVTNSCPAMGCASGTTCVHGAIANAVLPLGCAPIPAACAGTPTCACMACICGGDSICTTDPGTAGVECGTPTESRRSVKTDIIYVDGEERAALARRALEIPLAHYRYKYEPADARRRLGFIIDDQPDPSPAVLADRAHVDQYGYTSMLVATVQQQAKEIDELRGRLERLEQRAR